MTAASYPPDLDRILSVNGYALESETAVQTLELGSSIEVPDGPAIALSLEVSDEWLSAFCQLTGLDERKKRIARQLLLNVVPQKCVASISNGEGRIIACGLGVL